MSLTLSHDQQQYGNVVNTLPCNMRNTGEDAHCNILPLLKAATMATSASLGTWATKLTLRFKEFPPNEDSQETLPEGVWKLLKDVTDEKQRLTQVLFENVRHELGKELRKALAYFYSVSSLLDVDIKQRGSKGDDGLLTPSPDYEKEMRKVRRVLRILLKFMKDLRSFETYFHQQYEPLMELISLLHVELGKHEELRQWLAANNYTITDAKRHDVFQRLSKLERGLDKLITRINEERSQFRQMLDFREEKGILAFQKWSMSDMQKPVNVTELKFALNEILPRVETETNNNNNNNNVNDEKGDFERSEFGVVFYAGGLDDLKAKEQALKIVGEQLISRLAAYLNSRLAASTRQLQELFVHHARKDVKPPEMEESENKTNTTTREFQTEEVRFEGEVVDDDDDGGGGGGNEVLAEDPEITKELQMLIDGQNGAKRKQSDNDENEEEKEGNRDEGSTSGEDPLTEKVPTRSRSKSRSPFGKASKT